MGTYQRILQKETGPGILMVNFVKGITYIVHGPQSHEPNGPMLQHWVQTNKELMQPSSLFVIQYLLNLDTTLLKVLIILFS